MFRSADESLKGGIHLLLFWNGLLVTGHTFVFILIISVVNSLYTFMAWNRVSKSCLMAEHCFHILCILVVFRYIFLAFTTSRTLMIRRISLLWSSSPTCSLELLHGRNVSATALGWLFSDTALFYVHSYNICGEPSAHVSGEE